MQLLDLSFSSPAENLAADETLLDWREDDEGEEILRFWESPETFVVVGYANKVAVETNVTACRAQNISILRRCSGGGTVLQGRGCLNYALILRIAENSPLASISSANRFIMERNRAAIHKLLPQAKISVRGHTDLAIGDLKFSGNSQRRRKKFLLFHGTFLLNFDLALVSEFLRMPSKQPDYRQSRNHGDFLANLGLSANVVKTAFKESWNADKKLNSVSNSEIKELAACKYLTDGWNLKF